MSHNASYKEAVVYETLWKPLMLWGLPRDYAFLAAGVGLYSWPVFESVCFTALLGFFLWLFGWLMAKKDPAFMTCFWNKFRRVGSTKGKYKGNEYIP